MTLFWQLALFVVGFVILVKGSNALIDAARSLARRLAVSSWIIGVVLVGIGTSIPELAINVASSFDGVDIGLGTIAGSNTFNTLAILGLVALLYPVTMRREWIRRDLPLNAVAVLLALSLLAFPVLGDSSFSGLTRPEAAVLLVAFLAWLTYEIKRRRMGWQEDTEARIFALPLAFLLALGGLLGVIFGGKWVVDGGEALARLFGASEAFIGLTIVAIGTSLPELTVSVAAARKKNPGVAVGNIVGSNIFDFLGIFGFVGLLRPIRFPAFMTADVLVTFGVTLLLAVFMFVGRRYVLTRGQGALFIFIYLAYFAFLVLRG